MNLIKTEFINKHRNLKTKIFKDRRDFTKETFQKKIVNRDFTFNIMFFLKKTVLSNKKQNSLVLVKFEK
jgi:hypothetical protein